MAEIAAHEEAEESEEHSDEDEQDDEDEHEGADEDARAAEPTAADATATEPPSLDTLSLAYQPPHPPTSEPEHDEADDKEDDEDDSEAESDDSAAPSVADTLAHRRHRPSARRTAPDVAAIVTNKLAKNKASSERKHHGKKPQTSNVLGRNKGSKAKQSRTRAIKDGGDF